MSKSGDSIRRHIALQRAEDKAPVLATVAALLAVKDAIHQPKIHKLPHQLFKQAETLLAEAEAYLKARIK